MTDLQKIREKVRANETLGEWKWEGLTSAEIGRLNRAIMFGDEDEAFPDDDEWSRIVD